MGMKIRLRYLVFILILLSIISLVLTMAVVFRPVEIFSPNGFTRNVASTNQDASTQTRVSYSMEDVFRPTRFIISHENKGKMTSDSTIIASVNEGLVGKFKDISKKEILSQEVYEQLVLRDSFGQLLFDAPVTFGVMTRYFNDVPEEYKQETFSRILYRHDDSKNVYFINDYTKQVFQAKTDQDIQSELSNYYDDTKFHLVESYILKNKQIFIEVNDLALEKQTYLMEQIPMSFYITQLFANPSELRNRSDGQSIIYNDNLSQLKMDRSTNVISYYQNRVDDEQLTTTVHLQQSFAQMKKLGGWKLGMSFSDFDSERKIVEYMRYVGTYPILSNAKEGLSQFIITATGIEKMRVSSLIAETPIPSKNESIDLMSGKELMDQILGKGIALDTLEDIRLGYAWQLSRESNQVVEFVPNWFIKIDHKWKTLEEISLPTLDQGGDSDGF
ncbi:two-component system activity regulator YycH [uncultured Granulicatella sp.]|jgi:yycH protein|uniref:YycH family regulatory protein n=1 Tax=uncultured Granulicatella sp. TaxID=316089 RepID=UPI0028ED23EF|nr:two-component system activity regulator YycH [uncultured Granulicatella sp.]